MALLLFPAGYTWPSEIDNFTQRYQNLKDVTEIINKKTNYLLDLAINTTNALPYDEDGGYNEYDNPQTCNELQLYENINRYMGLSVIGQIEIFIHGDPRIDKRRLKRKYTIYRDFKFRETPTLGSVGKIGAIIRLGDHIIGSDKFGHFFTEGFGYFKRAYLKKKGINAALSFGERTERAFFGAFTTGVYSYADLTANFNGMRFWNHLLNKNPDILNNSKVSGPYVECIGNVWRKVKDLDWRDYVDAGWDEGINCNLFRNQTLVRKVTNILNRLEQDTGLPMRCPIAGDSEGFLKKKYGRYFSRLINLDGHRSLANIKKAQVKKDLKL